MPVVVLNMDAFPQFSRLPAELRSHIWRMTPATLSFYEFSPKYRQRPYIGHFETETFEDLIRYQLQPSSAYQACREARSTLAPLYERQDRYFDSLPDWFRFDLDFIQFDVDILFKMAGCPGCADIQHISLTVAYTPHYLEWLHCFKSLKLLVLVIKSKPNSEERPASYRKWREAWYPILERWHSNQSEQPNVSWNTLIVHRGVPGDAWLTSQDYIQDKKYQTS